MKKYICFFLALALLCGCGAQENSDENSQAAVSGVHFQLDGEDISFEPWEQEGLPMEGSYYLTQDVLLEQPFTITGQLKLHLNGHEIRGAENTPFGNVITVAAGGELVLCDAPNGEGRVVCPRSFSANMTVGSLIRVAGSMTMAGGTVDATSISLEDMANGAGFYVDDGGVLNVCGGTIIGGTTWCSSLTAPVPEETQPAEGQPAEGQTTETQPAETQPAETQPETTQPAGTEDTSGMDYEVLGKGGSIYVAGGGTCNISGGEIREGSAGLGGNLYVETEGLVTMTGGTIADGESVFHGGNVYICGTMEISGGEFLRGGAYNNGGNFFVEGTLEMTGGEIAEGTCDVNGMGSKRGGNMLVSGENAIVHISNAEIRDGSASGGEGFGGNISVIGWGAKEMIIRDSVISGGMGHRAGNLYIGTIKKTISDENLDYQLINVTLKDGISSYRGSNICIDSDVNTKTIVLNMENCDLIDSENTTRDNLSVGAGAADQTWCEVIMTGGSIQGGTLTIYGLATVTTYGAKLDRTEHSHSGTLIQDP